MAATLGRENARIEQHILKDCHRYSFVQAVDVLQGLCRAQGVDPDHHLQIRPDLTLSPSRTEVSAIHRVSRDDGSVGYELVTNVLGLYGANSPLPHFLTEELIEADQHDQNGGRVLLDILHQILFRLYHRALTRHHPMAGEQQHNEYIRLLRSLVGMRDQVLWERFANPQLLLIMMNIYRSRRGSSAGLHSILTYLFPRTDIVVSQCVERLMKIPAGCSLSLGETAHELGTNALIGDECYDSSGMFVVNISTVTAEQYGELIEDAQAWQSLIHLIRYYLKQPLICQLRIQVKQSRKTLLKLGEQGWSQLGTDSWLFDSRTSQSQHDLAVVEAVLVVE